MAIAFLANTGEPTTAAVVYDNGPIGYLGNTSSTNSDSSVSATPIVITDSLTFDGLNWRGFYSTSESLFVPPDDTFTLLLYDANMQPWTTRHVEGLARSPAGLDPIAEVPTYDYSGLVSPVTLDVPGVYWLGISDSLTGKVPWVWTLAFSPTVGTKSYRSSFEMWLPSTPWAGLYFQATLSGVSPVPEIDPHSVWLAMAILAAVFGLLERRTILGRV